MEYTKCVIRKEAAGKEIARLDLPFTPFLGLRLGLPEGSDAAVLQVRSIVFNIEDKEFDLLCDVG